jgi:hypothetical protein
MFIFVRQTAGLVGQIGPGNALERFSVAYWKQSSPQSRHDHFAHQNCTTMGYQVSTISCTNQCLSIYLSVCLSIYLSVYLSIYLYGCSCPEYIQYTQRERCIYICTCMQFSVM